MRLGNLIKVLSPIEFQGDPEAEISGLVYDSRLVMPGGLFVALRGHRQDGRAYIQDAVSRGAAAIVSESPIHASVLADAQGLARIQVPDARRALSMLAVAFYEAPFTGLSLVGITGTNGKTTTSFLIESILTSAGRRPGVIGTINYRFCDQVLDAPVTTPESLDLMRILRRMADSGVTDVVMEVSSHSLDQGRVRDCPFRVAVFTNLSQDHLDYHGSLEAYFEAKARLFRSSPEDGQETPGHAVINADDPKGQALMNMTRARVITYGRGHDCLIRAEAVKVTREGIRARLITPEGAMDIVSSLMGAHDIYNIMAAAGVAFALGHPLESVREGISRLKGVPGRLERVENRRGLSIMVDYAHTPDALLKALQAVRLLTSGRVITVFGCGGDRDRGKRREMGRIAGMGSDKVFITSDNPRTEDPAAIAAEIEIGVKESGIRDYMLDLDRRKAIEQAVRTAEKGDLVLIAGKGHETYQIIGSEKRPFDDRVIAAQAANALGSGEAEASSSRELKG